ncbi:MAG: hypothetical protein KJ624_02640 [Chloroflexi bacterium]|nr:hypothetical protein [Chloroflexota bacterium]
MEIREAAELIEAIAKSLAENPSQFNFEIHVIGTQAIARGGGTGLSVTAVGGGPGSITTGFVSSLSGANIEIAQKAANAAIQQDMSALVKALDNLAAELRSTTPDKKRISAVLDSLKQSWIPNVITSVIANIITKTLG